MTITQSEALALVADESTENLPYRIINERGYFKVLQWVHSVAHEPAFADPGAFATDAEQSANNAGPGEAVIIEMRGHQTKSRNPETLTLDDDCFDWVKP